MSSVGRMFKYISIMIARIVWRLFKIDKLSILIMLVYFLFIRVFFFAIYRIPSSSMVPTLLNKDLCLTSKIAYGYNKYSFPFGYLYSGKNKTILPGEIQVGDVIVFWPPSKKYIDFYIKTVIAGPGDKVEISNGEVIVNEKKLELREVNSDAHFTSRETGSDPVSGKIYEETLSNGKKHLILKTIKFGKARLDFPNKSLIIEKIPDGYYFAMGDNRDNSQDSRTSYYSNQLGIEQGDYDFGLVPRDNIIARADMIIASTNAHFFEVHKWLTSIRPARILLGVGKYETRMMKNGDQSTDRIYI